MKSCLDTLIRIEYRELPILPPTGQRYRVILHCDKHTYGGLFTFDQRLTMKGPNGRSLPVREGDKLWLNYEENGPLKNVVWAESSIKTN